MDRDEPLLRDPAATIQEDLDTWETPFVELDTFGTADAQRIAEIVDEFARERLGSPVAGYLFYSASVGSTHGVRLADGRSPAPERTGRVWTAVVGAAPAGATAGTLTLVAGGLVTGGLVTLALVVGLREPAPGVTPPRAPQTMSRNSTPSPDEDPPEEPPLIPETQKAAIPVPTEPGPPAQEERPPVRSSSRAPFEPEPASAAPAAPRVSEELRLIERARVELGHGRPKQALQLLDEHERTFPRGTFTEERQGLRIIALCAAGKEPQGRGEAHGFMSSHPTSPLLGRIRGACGIED